MPSSLAKSHLILENGHVFSGLGSSQISEVIGEVVFNTSLTGYQEILTDPSYANQIIVFTNPHLGNTGINQDDHESSAVMAKGIIAREIASDTNHWNANCSLSDFLSEKRIPFVHQTDTRAIVKLLTREGSQWGAIVNGKFDQIEMLHKIQLAKTNSSNSLMSRGSEAEPYVYCRHPSAHFHVIVYDFGVKKSILKPLEEGGCSVTIVPWNTTLQTILSFQPQGVILSNGPGDPHHRLEIFETVRKMIKKRIPIMGICLGHQILALACGAQIKKMKHGHHGSNHPIHINSSNRFFITAQNHGYCVSDEGLPKDLQVTLRSLFDQTIQGISHRLGLAIGFQGHPEASPGPHDLKEVFNQFFRMMRTEEIHHA